MPSVYEGAGMCAGLYLNLGFVALFVYLSVKRFYWIFLPYIFKLLQVRACKPRPNLEYEIRKLKAYFLKSLIMQNWQKFDFLIINLSEDRARLDLNLSLGPDLSSISNNS